MTFAAGEAKWIAGREQQLRPGGEGWIVNPLVV